MRRLIVMLLLLMCIAGGVAAETSIHHWTSVVLADDDCDSSGSGNPCDDDQNDDRNDDQGNHGGQHGGDDDRDAAAQTALAQPVGEREIRIVDERFTPDTITIQAGESLTFVNADDDEQRRPGPGSIPGKCFPATA